MSKGRRSRPHTGEGSALVGEIEGYLKARTCYLQAREEAETLRSKIPWMTTAQADEITRHYIEQRISLTRRALVHYVDDLREQYETRYRELRRDLLKRHAAVACAVLAGSTGVTAAACTLWR